jgi:hypothetical protein
LLECHRRKPQLLSGIFLSKKPLSTIPETSHKLETALERILQYTLRNAPRIGSRSNPGDVAVTQATIGVSEIGVVEGVEQFRAEL